MDLRQMEYLVALADERQFTRAAQLVGVSQSGLSAAVRGLEEELGASLFTRTTRRVEPTEAGLALLPYARSMLAQAAAARDAVVRATRALSGSLRVGSEQCLGVLDVTALLERFHRRYPQVEIHFAQAGSHDLLARVREGDLDVAFVATTEHLGPLSQTVLGSEPLVLVCAPEHPLAGRGRV
ncbi:MAG: LysR family transcriptional regulator, partial [Cellulosimicrobium funkei]